MYRNGMVAGTAKVWRRSSLPYRPGPKPENTDGTNCPSFVVEHPLPEPVSIQPDSRPRSSFEPRWEVLGAPGGRIGQIARRCTEPLRGLSRRFAPWRRG